MAQNILGPIIKQLRMQKHLTQRDLSQVTGFSQNTISNHENQNRSLDEEDISTYANALGTTPQRMFDLATTDESATDVEITEILKQLNDHQKQRVINFAKIQLAEQQNKITEIREKSMNLPDTLAAHADDPRRTYSDKELADINNYLDAWIDHEENKKK